MARFLVTAAFSASLLSGTAAHAEDTPSLTIKKHAFSPDTLEIPAGKRVKVTISNTDTSAEEFDSHDLQVEKMIPAGQTVTVFVGPLKPGSYSFVGELHEATAHGTLVAK